MVVINSDSRKDKKKKMVFLPIKVAMVNDREIDLSYFNVTAFMQNIFRIQFFIINIK